MADRLIQTGFASNRPEPRDINAAEAGEIDWLVRKLLLAGIDGDELISFIRTSIQMWEEELGW